MPAGRRHNQTFPRNHSIAAVRCVPKVQAGAHGTNTGCGVQVTLIEGERLPPHSVCIQQLVHNPFVAAVPLGHAHGAKMVGQVVSVFDEKSTPPVVTILYAQTGEEIVAQLCAFMVPLTPRNVELPTVWGSDSASWKCPLAWRSPAESASHGADLLGRQGLQVSKGSPVATAWGSGMVTGNGAWGGLEEDGLRETRSCSQGSSGDKDVVAWVWHRACSRVLPDLSPAVIKG
jgi:hypothetical protein